MIASPCSCSFIAKICVDREIFLLNSALQIAQGALQAWPCIAQCQGVRGSGSIKFRRKKSIQLNALGGLIRQRRLG
ncbi:hypothetical protein, partial [Comamonas aquatica]